MAKPMITMQHFIILFLILVFISGIFVIFWVGFKSHSTINVLSSSPSPTPSLSLETTSQITSIETTSNPTPEHVPDDCPDLLIRRGHELLVYNT